jgi:hypothetical protein
VLQVLVTACFFVLAVYLGSEHLSLYSELCPDVFGLQDHVCHSPNGETQRPRLINAILPLSDYYGMIASAEVPFEPSTGAPLDSKKAQELSMF